MTATMTDKQRQAVAAMEAARSQGCSLQWPPPNWIAAMSTESTDAAP